MQRAGLPGGSAVRMPSFHCHSPGPVSVRGTEIPQATLHVYTYERVCVCVCVCVCTYIYMNTHTHTHTEGFPGGSVGKKNLPTIQETSCNAGDPGLILGWGRSPGEGNVNPHQNSCLENSMDRGAWWPKVHGISRVGHDLVTNHHTRTHTSIYLYRQIQQ